MTRTRRCTMPRNWLGASVTLPLCAGGLQTVRAEVRSPDAIKLVDAIKKSDKTAIRGLLQKRVDVNGAEPDGTTPLQWAVYLDDVETTELLIRAGAKPTAANRYGVTPLPLACSNGN